MKKNPVVHFEMGAKDQKRMSEFYAKTFGWGTQQMGADMGDYVWCKQQIQTKKGW
jgi:predicted enzyme related to lactoylglutathione lyase